MEQIDQEQTNGDISDTEGAQSNVSQEQYSTTVRNPSPAINSTLIQATVVQSPQQFSQTAVSVIQPAQASVIQTATSAQQLQQIPQAIQFHGVIDQDDDLDEEGKKRRDILSRRPSYRKIYDDLSDGSIKVEDENGQVMGRVTTISASAISDQPTSQTVTLPSGIQITTQGGAFPASLQSISGQSATVVQYPTGQQSQDGQFIYAAAPGDVEGMNSGTTVYAIPSSQAYAVRGQLPQGVVINPVPTASLQTQQQHGPEDATRKREMRLLKNREAAKECRRKKKEYVKCLENRVAVLENQNKTLIEELKALKDLYCHKAE